MSPTTCCSSRTSATRPAARRTASTWSRASPSTSRGTSETAPRGRSGRQPVAEVESKPKLCQEDDMRTHFITFALLALMVGVAAALQAGPRVPAAAQVTDRCPATTLDAKKAIARGWHESLNQRNLDALDGLLASDIVHHSATFPDTEGPAGVTRILGAAFTGFPDVRWTVEDVIA